MTDTFCAYEGDRDGALVALLYDDIDPTERASFETHLETCARCRAELSGLRGVRAQLGRWAPPEPARAVLQGALAAPETPRGWHLLRDVPAWAQVAAALLFVGVAAGLANLDVRYDRTGVTLRTGWSKLAAPVAGSVSASPAGATPWRGDLVALERRLRAELGAAAAGRGTQPVAARPAGVDAEVLQRVRALVEESERRQQRELALRLAQVVKDVQAQRRSDLVQIDRSLGQIQNNTGVEVLKQRELLNYLVRVSSQR